MVRTPRAAARSDAGIGHVAANELAAHALERRRAARVAHHRPDEGAVAGEIARDVTSDEAARAGDEDHSASEKFCQYRLGVGPRCPWYFDPSDPEPYGVSAGSDICTKESWPIFMPG